jgi:hypothetical protein
MRRSTQRTKPDVLGNWFWASAVTARGKLRESVEAGGEGNPSPSDVVAGKQGFNPPAPVENPDAELQDLLLQNANLTAGAFLQLLKSRGFTFAKTPEPAPAPATAPLRDGAEPGPGPAPTEADTASGHPHAFRPRESCHFKSHFIESAMSDNGIGATRFRAVLLEEGLGNFRDGYYYSKEALKSGVFVFEGKKIYADHPSRTEEDDRPERSVRDVLGYFEHCAYQESEDGRGQLVADVCVLPDRPYDWARALMRESVEYTKKHPDKSLVGLSINANGDADQMAIEEFITNGMAPPSAMPKVREAQAQGLIAVKIVKSFFEAVSCDMVTEAGAGGKVLSIVESFKGKGIPALENKSAQNKERSMKVKKNKESVEGDNKEAAPDAPAKKDGEEGGAAKDGDACASDKAMIQSMLDKYMGKEDHSEEVQSQATEAYKAACESGMESEEAQAAVGHSMKMARVMKQAAAKKEAAGSDKKDDDAEADTKESSDDSKKEPVKEAAAGGEIARLKGENASLRESLAKIELSSHIDTTLGKSGLPRAVTKKLLEGSYKNKEHFDREFSAFQEGYKAARGETDAFAWLGHEKTVESKKSKGFDFSDCLK